MHKAEVEQMREEITVEIMENQEENQRGRGLNREDQEIASTMGNQGRRRKITKLERTMKEKNKMVTKR